MAVGCGNAHAASPHHYSARTLQPGPDRASEVPPRQVTSGCNSDGRVGRGRSREHDSDATVTSRCQGSSASEPLSFWIWGRSSSACSRRTRSRGTATRERSAPPARTRASRA
eukprot:3777519-Rhodomonas_salina.5